MDLNLIKNDQKQMEQLLIDFCQINSFSYNVRGLDLFREKIIKEFMKLNLQVKIEEIELEDEMNIDQQANKISQKLAKSLLITKLNARPDAKKILLMGHMDTVYPENLGFNNCKLLSEGILNGPGVADLKGGLVVLLKAIEYFEKTPEAENVRWQIFLNSEEEIGSPGSQQIFPKLVDNNHLALLYEPSLSDGSIAYKRKGTGNYQLVVRGKAAHVGRDFSKGVSAILASANFIQKANSLNTEDIIINFGKIQGGGPLNVVPDLCITGINIRVENIKDIDEIEKKFVFLLKELNSTGVQAELIGKINRKPKIPNKKLDELFLLVEEAANELGQKVPRINTGGCCDGNNLYELGLVNIDTLGVRGGNLHSKDEFVCLESLSERAMLSCLLLQKIARKKD